MSMMLDLGIVKKDFTSLMGNIHPWMLSHFVMWLDIKVAEYKVYGHMVLDDTPNDTPKWLRGQRSQEQTDISNSGEANESWSQTEAGCLPVPPSFTDALSISSQKHSNPLDRGSVWTNEEILNLIQVWSDPEVQVQFGQSYRNSTTYEKIAANMKLLGYGRTWQQCRNKIKLLKSEYYKVIKHGSKKKKYIYHDLMDKVLGGNQQEMAEMLHDGSDTEVVEEFDNDTSVEMQECDSVGGDDIHKHLEQNSVIQIERGSIWGNDETLCLIKIWSNPVIQLDFKLSQSMTYQKIATEMKSHGFDRSCTQCRNKMECLKTEYYVVKEKGSMENFIYYEYLVKVLGEIQPKPYAMEQAMSGKIEDEEVNKKTYSKSGELSNENDDQEMPVLKIDRDMPVPKIDRGLTWTKEETIALIQIWSDPDILSELGSHHYSDTYLKIEAKMRECGFNKVWRQCRTKIKVLKQEYFEVKKHGSQKIFNFYDLMDKVLAGKEEDVGEMLHDGNDDEILEETESKLSSEIQEARRKEEQRLKEICVSQDGPHQGNIVDETMKTEIDLEHVEKATMSQSKEATSCQQDEKIPQSDVCDDDVWNEDRHEKNDSRKSKETKITKQEKERGNNWTQKETMALIDIWSEDQIKSEMEKSQYKSKIIGKIFQKMKDAGFNRSVKQCVIKIKGLRDEYFAYKKSGVKTRFFYLYFQKMDQILRKSQEIPNFELTNFSVSDDSSVDTVDKCDQIGAVGPCDQIGMVGLGINNTEDSDNDGQSKLFIVKTRQGDDNFYEDKTSMNIDAESRLKGDKSDNHQISVDKTMNSSGRDLYIKGQEHARSKFNSRQSENEFETIPCLASGPAMTQQLQGSSKGQPWSYYETCMLIDIWSNPKFQFQLESSYRNNATFEKVACLMKKNGYNRSLHQCRLKIKGLKKDYNMCRKNIAKKNHFQFFEKMDAVLGSGPIVIMDTCDDGTDMDYVSTGNEAIEEEMNSSSTTFSMPDNRGAFWKYAETIDLLDLWSDPTVQEEIKNTLRNTPIFEKIVLRMQFLGHEKTINQCRNRIKTLKTEYNKCLKDKTGKMRRSFSFFHEMDSVLQPHEPSLFFNNDSEIAIGDESNINYNVDISLQSFEGASNRQVFPLQEGSPSPVKQPRLCSTSHDHSTSHDRQSHDQHNLQQSHQTPQGQSFTQRPLPNLMRQPQNYRIDNQSTVPQPHQQSSEKVHTESNIDGNNANEADQGLQHFEERGSVQDMLDNIHLSQIQLQERWSQEIRKSVNQTGVTAIRSSSGDVQSEKISRSTIVLNEPYQQHDTTQSDELQKRLSFEPSRVGPSENDDKVSSESPHQNIIKIELSSDEEELQTDCYNNTLRGETTPAVYDTGQGETTSSGMIEFDSKAYSLHETNLKEVANDISPRPVSLHSTSDRILVRGKNEDEASWRNKKWEYFEKLRKTQSSSYVGAKVHSQSLQNLLPFPDPFPLDNLQYGQRAQEMINSGVITRSGKMQFLDTVFNEVVKYTGLYPTPQQKIDVAKAIVTTFPKLDTKTHPGHSSSIDSWLTVLNDKYRNERRQLNHGPFYRKPVRYVCAKKCPRKYNLEQTLNMSRGIPSLQDCHLGNQNLNLDLTDDMMNDAIQTQLQLVSGQMEDNSSIKTEPQSSM